MRNLFPVPTINTVLQGLEGFIYAMPLDLSMVYYTLRFNLDLSKMCTIVFLWGNDFKLQLPMVIICSPDIFQATMSEQMVTLKFI